MPDDDDRSHEHSHGRSHDHGDGHGHGHGHGHGPSLARAGARFQRPLTIAFALVLGYFVVEAVAGVMTDSLALLSDAGHMLTDVIGLGMSLAAIRLANRYDPRSSNRHTFGLYRLEILAAFVNALLLFGVAIWVMIESVRRLFGETEVLDTPMLIVAVVGLGVNVVSFLLLREGSKESINIEGAYLEVLADGIGSVGVILAALLIRWFGWTWADPVIAALLGLWILPRTWRLGRRAVNILLQAAPEGFDVAAFTKRLTSIAGVVGVHDVHVWTLTSDMNAASAHIVTTTTTDAHAVLDAARELCLSDFAIDHGTFQIEPDDHTGCDELSW